MERDGGVLMSSQSVFWNFWNDGEDDEDDDDEVCDEDVLLYNLVLDIISDGNVLETAIDDNNDNDDADDGENAFTTFPFMLMLLSSGRLRRRKNFQ